MFLVDPLRRALILGFAFAALLGGDALHGLLHGSELRPADDVAHGSQLHGDDCEHGTDIEALPHDAHCLLCSSSRHQTHQLPPHGATLVALTPAPRSVSHDATRQRPQRRLCAPLGARAPPREA